MPVVTFRRPDICRVIGQDVPMDELTERMPMMGGDLDAVEGEDITIEWFPDRPDLLMLEGTGRALRGFLGKGDAAPSYEVQPARTELRVDESVAAVRPHAALCFVRGVPFDEDYVKLVVDAQEKITLAPGRRRKKIAVGIHDARALEGPFTYTCVGRDEKPFEPLQWDGPLTPSEIVERHPKGQEFGHLLPSDRFPVFLDGEGEVLSMPPVINAARTTVTTATKDLLIDVTGTDAQAVRRTVALLASGFAERGGTIEAVTVHDAGGRWDCPDLRPTEHVLHADDVRRLLGIALEGDDLAAALRRMGHDAEPYENKVLVRTPAWRFDILHPVDLMEDVAIGYGFENFQGTLPATMTFGGALAHQDTEEALRDLLVGHGIHEARTLTLTDPSAQWSWWGQESQPAVRLRNPVVEDQTILRQRLVPSLLQVLAANRHRSLPQRLFELGYVVVEEDGSWRNRMRLGVVECAAKTGFSEAKGLAEAVARDMGVETTLEAADEPGFIAGRQGALVVAGHRVGHFGELHPETVVRFRLGAATTALELDVEALARARRA